MNLHAGGVCGGGLGPAAVGAPPDPAPAGRAAVRAGTPAEEVAPSLPRDSGVRGETEAAEPHGGRGGGRYDPKEEEAQGTNEGTVFPPV